MNLFVEVVVALLQVLWLLLVGIAKALVPAAFQGRKDVQGQVVLITGAGSGLGRLMSLRFAILGSRLVLWDIDEKGNKETAQLVTNLGGEVHLYTVDLSSREDIYKKAAAVKEEVGDVDILVNNAGIVTGKKLMDCPDNLIEKTMAVNINAHFWTVKSFLPSMLARNQGHIITIASAAGLFGVAGLVDYCASKSAAIGLDESLRNELSRLGKTNIHTTCVCPFYISTGMFSGVKSRFPNIFPIMKPDVVVDRIMDAVLTNRHMLLLPRVLYTIFFLKSFMPVRVGEVLTNLFGINNTMDEFIGRQKMN